MSPDFLRLRYLQSAADDTPLHTPPPPTPPTPPPLVILLSMFKLLLRPVPKEALTGRKNSLLIFYDCDICSQRLMTLLFTRPLSPLTPPVILLSLFLTPSQEVPKEAKIFRYFNQVATVVMLFETGGFLILNNNTVVSFIFFLTILSPDYPSLFMY